MKDQIETQSMLDGINFAFFVSTIVAAGALVLTFFIKRVTPPKDNVQTK
nr:hypothetical protein [Sporosarcina jiandibaonis]